MNSRWIISKTLFKTYALDQNCNLKNLPFENFLDVHVWGRSKIHFLILTYVVRRFLRTVKTKIITWAETSGTNLQMYVKYCQLFYLGQTLSAKMHKYVMYSLVPAKCSTIIRDFFGLCRYFTETISEVIANKLSIRSASLLPFPNTVMGYGYILISHGKMLDDMLYVFNDFGFEKQFIY